MDKVNGNHLVPGRNSEMVPSAMWKLGAVVAGCWGARVSATWQGKGLGEVAEESIHGSGMWVVKPTLGMRQPRRALAQPGSLPALGCACFSGRRKVASSYGGVHVYVHMLS